MFQVLSVELIILAVICILLILMAYFAYRFIKNKNKSNLIVIIIFLVLSMILSGILLFRSFSGNTDVINGTISGSPEYISSNKFNFVQNWEDTNKKISDQSDKNVGNSIFSEMILKFKCNENEYENTFYQLVLVNEDGENVADIFSIEGNDISYNINNEACKQLTSINAGNIMQKLDSINILNFITENIDTNSENEIYVVVELDNQNSITVKPDDNIFTVENDKIVKLEQQLKIDGYYLRIFINGKYDIYFNVS